RVVGEFLRRFPLRGRLAAPRFFVAAVVAVTDDPAVRILVVLERPSQAGAGAHVGAAVLLDGIESVGADPDRVRSAIVAIALRQSVSVIKAIHLQSEAKLPQTALTSGAPGFFFGGG